MTRTRSKPETIVNIRIHKELMALEPLKHASGADSHIINEELDLA